MTDDLEPGMLVLWGASLNTAQTGTLICLVVDEDTGEQEFCSDAHPDGPGRLWTIRFKDRLKKRCCEKSIQAIVKEGGGGEHDGYKEAAIAWAVCASIHREYAKGRDPLYTTRQADYMRAHEAARTKAMRAAQEDTGNG